MSFVAKLIARAKQDAEFKAKLLADPQSALREAGIELPREGDPDVTADLGELAPLLAANHRGSYDETVELDAPEGGIHDQTLKAEAEPEAEAEAEASAGADSTLDASGEHEAQAPDTDATVPVQAPDDDAESG